MGPCVAYLQTVLIMVLDMFHLLLFMGILEEFKVPHVFLLGFVIFDNNFGGSHLEMVMLDMVHAKIWVYIVCLQSFMKLVALNDDCLRA